MYGIKNLVQLLMTRGSCKDSAVPRVPTAFLFFLKLLFAQLDRNTDDVCVYEIKA